MRMQRITGACLVALALLLDSVSAGVGEPVHNCAWNAYHAANPNKSVADFLEETIVGDWINAGGRGFLKGGGMVFPIAASPTEVIRVFRKGDRLFARNQRGNAQVELFLAGDPQWTFDDNDPLGDTATSVLSGSRIEQAAGCPITDLPRLLGKGKWVVPGQGFLDVTLFMIPVGPEQLNVLMEGTGVAAGTPVYIRRGYAMKSMRLVPLTDD